MPSEESPQEQAHTLAVGAREALPQREPEARSGVETAVLLLAEAIERLTDSTPGFVLNLDEYGPGQLEALRDRVIGGEGPIRRQSPTKFTISFPDVEIDTEDIWPEGGAPDDPTPEDVIAVMEEAEYAHPMHVIREWLLIESLFVRDAEDEDGEGEVEWDGS